MFIYTESDTESHRIHQYIAQDTSTIRKGISTFSNFLKNIFKQFKFKKSAFYADVYGIMYIVEGHSLPRDALATYGDQTSQKYPPQMFRTKIVYTSGMFLNIFDKNVENYS